MPVIEPLLERIRKRLGISAQIWAIGNEEIHAHGAPPRYVWVPTDEDEEPPEQGDDDEGPAVAATRLSTIVVHIWGRDIGDVEDRWHDLRATLQKEFGTAVRVGTGAWARGEVLHCGSALSMPITFRIPVHERAQYTYSKAPHQQGVDTSGSASGDGVLQNPE
jgi:hypothetical protein